MCDAFTSVKHSDSVRYIIIKYIIIRTHQRRSPLIEEDVGEHEFLTVYRNLS